MPTYLVTGARAGIGLGHIQQLAASPSNIVFAVIRNRKDDFSALEKIRVAGPGTVYIVECDVSIEEAIATLPERLRKEAGPGPDIRLDVVINNAAVLNARDENTLNITAGTLLWHFSCNAVGPALVTEALLPLLAPGAKIANISSGAGSLAMLSDGRIAANNTAYSISKAALNMLTVHQAKQMADRAIVVCIDPGHVKTKMGDGGVVEVEHSAGGVLKLIHWLEKEDSGKFYHYLGGQVDW